MTVGPAISGHRWFSSPNQLLILWHHADVVTDQRSLKFFI